MREDARAVDALPVEGVVRERIGLVPRDLLGEEVVHPGLARDLRERARVAERVGQPDLARLVAQLLQEEPLALHELAGQRLRAGHVGVRLHPHPADRHEAALGDAHADALEQLGVEPLHPRELLGRRAREHEVRVLVHEVEDVGEGPRALADGLAHRPQPGGVDVRVAHREHLVRGRSGGRRQHAGERGAACPSGRTDVERVDRRHRVLQRGEQCGPTRGGRRELGGQAAHREDVLDQLPHLPVAVDDVHPAQRVDGLRRRGRLAADRRRPERPVRPHVGVGGRLHEQLERLPRRRLQPHVVVERLQRLDDRAVRRPDQPLRLEADLAGGEAEVDDQLHVIGSGLPLGRDRPGHTEPDRAPRPPPRPPDGERLERALHRLRERHRLVRHLPRLHGHRDGRPFEGGRQALADETVDPQLGELVLLVQGGLLLYKRYG